MTHEPDDPRRRGSDEQQLRDLLDRTWTDDDRPAADLQARAVSHGRRLRRRRRLAGVGGGVAAVAVVAVLGVTANAAPSQRGSTVADASDPTSSSTVSSPVTTDPSTHSTDPSTHPSESTVFAGLPDLFAVAEPLLPADVMIGSVANRTVHVDFEPHGQSESVTVPIVDPTGHDPATTAEGMLRIAASRPSVPGEPEYPWVCGDEEPAGDTCDMPSHGVVVRTERHGGITVISVAVTFDDGSSVQLATWNSLERDYETPSDPSAAAPLLDRQQLVRIATSRSWVG